MIWLAGGQVNARARYTATVKGKTLVCTVGEQGVRNLGQPHAHAAKTLHRPARDGLPERAAAP